MPTSNLCASGGNAYNQSMPSNEEMKYWVAMVRAVGMEPIIQVSPTQIEVMWCKK